MARKYGEELTKQIQIRVSVEMKKYLKSLPGDYGQYIRELIKADQREAKTGMREDYSQEAAQ